MQKERHNQAKGSEGQDQGGPRGSGAGTINYSKAIMGCFLEEASFRLSFEG